MGLLTLNPHLESCGNHSLYTRSARLFPGPSPQVDKLLLYQLRVEVALILLWE